MVVEDGQDVDAAVTNPAFISRNTDDTTPSRLGLGSTESDQGPSITWAQQQFNSICTFLGIAINQVYNFLPTWTNNDVGSSTDDVFTRVDDITQKFSGTTGGGGHAHTGTDGDGAPVAASSIASVPLAGFIIQGTNYTSGTSSSDNVSSYLTGRPVSTGSSVAGVVSTTPYNRVAINNSSTGEDYKDSSGNIVYGRLTYSGSTWTLSYYTLVSGTQTAYTFASASPIGWYFQELYNPLSGSAPVYSPAFFTPSANSTADVETATTTLQGKVQLSATAPADIASSGSAGTANATVANADHTHKGVHSLAVAATQLFGDIIMAAGGLLGVSISSQTITYTLTNPLTTLGDILYGGASGAWTRLAGNTTTTRKFLVSQGTGSAGQAPFYDTLQAGDVPTPVNTNGNYVTSTVNTTASTLSAPPNAVGFILTNLDVSLENVNWCIGATASTSNGMQLEPGRDTGFVPCAANISICAASGIQAFNIQWILSS